MLFFHQLQQFAFTHHRIGHVQACKFILAGRENAQFFDQPVVELPVGNKLQLEYAVGYFFNTVALSMREIVHGVNTPGISVRW